MSFLEGVRIALDAICGNLLRSFLTLLGIIIGISAIIVTDRDHQRPQPVRGREPQQPRPRRVRDAANRPDHEPRGLHDAFRRNRELRADRRARPRALVRPGLGGRRRGALAPATSSAAPRRCRTWTSAASTPQIVDDRALRGRRRAATSPRTRTRARPGCFIGADIATNLFGTIDPIGKTIAHPRPLVRGGRHREAEGLGLRLLAATTTSRSPSTPSARCSARARSVNISVKAVEGVPIEEAMDEVRALLRARHHLRSADDDDFGFVTAEGVNNLWENLTRDDLPGGHLRGRHLAGRRRHRDHEHHAGVGHRADARDRRAQGRRRAQPRHPLQFLIESVHAVLRRRADRRRRRPTR